MLLARMLAFACGAVLVSFTLLSALRIFVLPRPASDRLARVVLRLVRQSFNLRVRFVGGYSQADEIMALYAPVSLLALLFFWLSLILIGYAAMFWAVGEPPWQAVVISGSSLLTLGSEQPNTVAGTLLSFSEAAIGMLLAALLISYLPTIYAAFSRREAAVAMLAVRAGPLEDENRAEAGVPSALGMIKRFHRLDELEALSEIWKSWESWFVEVEESHTSLAVLTFYRSPRPNRSWVTAAGTVLDAAALRLSALDLPYDIFAALCIRAGFIALRNIASFFRLEFNAEPAPDAAISISRAEFDRAYAELDEAGVPLKADRDKAWRDFVAWRVNYDEVLLALAAITMSPPSPWARDDERVITTNHTPA